MDRAAGVSPGDRGFSARDFRPAFVEGAEACRRAVLAPEDDLGLDAALRAAVARRVARTAGNARLMEEYPAPDAGPFSALAEGGTPDDARLLAIARHADMIAAAPQEASAGHLEALLAAGLTVPQVIALSELLAFVCFEMRVAHGLSLLDGSAP